MRWRRFFGVGVLLGVVAGLSGCNVWRQVGHGPEGQNWNPDETAITPANVGTLHQQWAASGGRHEPIVDQGKVFVTDFDHGSGTGHAAALDADSGSLIWKQPVATTEMGQSVLMGDQLYGTWRTPDHTPICHAGEYRIDPDTGAILESVETTPISYGTPVPAGDVVVQVEEQFHDSGSCESVVDAERAVVVRDQATGTVLWRSVVLTDARDRLAVGDGRIYVAHKNGWAAFDLAGCGGASECTPAWDQPAPFPVFSSAPIFAGGRVFIVVTDDVSQSGGLVALDAATGNILWGGPTGRGRPTYADGLVYVAGDGDLRAYHAAGCNGSACLAWSAPLAEPSPYGSAGSVVVAGDVVYVNQWQGNAGQESWQFAFDADVCAAAGTCAPSWDMQGAADAISVAAGHVYFVNSPILRAFGPG